MSNIKVPENIYSNKLFRGVDNVIVAALFDPKNLEEIKEGELIYSTGSQSDFVYLLFNGEAKLKHSVQKRLMFKFKDDFFGEKEILDKSNRKTSAVANSDCLLYKIPSNLFVQLITKSNEAKSNVLMDENSESSGNDAKQAITSPQFEINSETKKFDLNSLEVSKSQEIKDIKIEEMTEINAERLNEEVQNKINLNLNVEPTNGSTVEEEIDSALQKIPKKENDDELIEILESSNVEKEEPQLNNSDNQGWEKFKGLLSPSDDLKRTVKDILNFLLKQTDSEIGAFYIYHKDENKLEDYYQTHDSFYKTKRLLKDGLTNLAIKQGKVIFINQFKNHTNYNHEIDHPNEFEGDTLIFIPLFNPNNELLAMVQIGSNQTDFTKDEEIKINNASKYSAWFFEQSLSTVPETHDEQETVQPTSEEMELITGLILEDIKNPVANIKHYASILSKLNTSEESKKIISLISAQSNSLLDIIQSINDYTNKNKSTDLEVSSFNELINQTLILLSDFVELHKVKLFKKLPTDSLINIDARKFYVACYFITKYACNKMTAGGNLFFSGNTDNSKLELIIKVESNKKIINTNKGIWNFYIPINDNKNNISGLAVPKFLIESMNGLLNFEQTESGLIFKISFNKAFS